jgi:hypothetical protein
MPSPLNPKLSGTDDGFFLTIPFIVEPQAIAGCPTNNGCAQNFQAIGCPDKVLSPLLLTGVKERNFSASVWINSCCEVVVMSITTMTTES